MSVAQALAVAVVICACYFYEVRVMPYTLAGIASGHSGHRVLYVLECEGSAEWQPVPAENPVVSWVQHMKDRLTMHSGNPEGEDLTVRTVPSHWCCSRYCLFSEIPAWLSCSVWWSRMHFMSIRAVSPEFSKNYTVILTRIWLHVCFLTSKIKGLSCRSLCGGCTQQSIQTWNLFKALSTWTIGVASACTTLYKHSCWLMLQASGFPSIC